MIKRSIKIFLMVAGLGFSVFCGFGFYHNCFLVEGTQPFESIISGFGVGLGLLPLLWWIILPLWADGEVDI